MVWSITRSHKGVKSFKKLNFGAVQLADCIRVNLQISSSDCCSIVHVFATGRSIFSLYRYGFVWHIDSFFITLCISERCLT